jgi:hypothetical protein
LIGLPSGIAVEVANIIHGTQARSSSWMRPPIEADTALRLNQLFGTTPEFWMNLQSFYDFGVGSIIEEVAGQLMLNRNGQEIDSLPTVVLTPLNIKQEGIQRQYRSRLLTITPPSTITQLLRRMEPDLFRETLEVYRPPHTL